MSEPSISDDENSGLALADSNSPRTAIHKKVLHVAEEKPDASIDTIAAEAPGASISFVKRVIAENGDLEESDWDKRVSEKTDLTENGGNLPVDQEEKELQSHHVENSIQTESDDQAPGTRRNSIAAPEKANLSPKEIKTLRVVREHPTATQSEIAEKIGISRAAVSKRLNNISEFDWKQRRLIVEELFDEDIDLNKQTNSIIDIESQRLEDISQRIRKLERDIQTDGKHKSRKISDPELIHKIAKASLDAGYISRAEELHILQSILSPAPETVSPSSKDEQSE